MESSLPPAFGADKKAQGLFLVKWRKEVTVYSTVSDSISLLLSNMYYWKNEQKSGQWMGNK